MAAFIEERWLPILESCRLYRYSFDRLGFEDTGDHGTHICSEAKAPISIEPVGPLQDQLEQAGVRLKSVESLQGLADAIKSSLHFSGIRLRNVQTWIPPDEEEWPEMGFRAPSPLSG